jgi:hypothetical protein
LEANRRAARQRYDSAAARPGRVRAGVAGLFGRRDPALCQWDVGDANSLRRISERALAATQNCEVRMNCYLRRPPYRPVFFDVIATLPLSAATAAPVLLNNDGPHIPDPITAQPEPLKLLVSELLWPFFRNTSARSTHFHTCSFSFKEAGSIVTFPCLLMCSSALDPEMRQSGGQVRLKRALGQPPLPWTRPASSHLVNLVCMPAAPTHWTDLPKGPTA